MSQRSTHNSTPERIFNNTNEYKFGISRKNTPKRIKEPEKTQQRKNLAYVATYNKNNPELFTEIMKNLERNWKQRQNQINTRHNKNN